MKATTKTTKAAVKNFVVKGNKKTLNATAKKTLADALAPKKRGRPSNAELAARKAKEEKAAARAAKVETKVANDFNLKAFKKAISRALRVFNKDMTDAQEVLATYKANRKLLKDALPKHAVNAFEKSLAAKKDEKLLEKAMFAAEKHIVEKDFTM